MFWEQEKYTIYGSLNSREKIEYTLVEKWR
jgi:hypothetical protein